MAEYRPLREETIVAVLLNIRAQIIRDGLDGLEHVEALLQARGVDPDEQRVPAKYNRRFRRGRFRSAVVRALRSGLAYAPEIASTIAAEHDTPYEAAYARVYSTLNKMRRQGLAAAETGSSGRKKWSLSDAATRQVAPQSAN